jgi:hypothetical protein
MYYYRSIKSFIKSFVDNGFIPLASQLRDRLCHTSPQVVINQTGLGDCDEY